MSSGAPTSSITHLLAVLVPVLFLAAPAFTQTDLRGQQYIDWFAKKYLPKQGTFTPDEIAELQEEKKKRDFAGVVRDATNIINRDPKLFYSPASANWTKALAYYERGWANYELTHETPSAEADIVSSAELGNFVAISQLSNSIMAELQKDTGTKKMDDLASKSARFLRMGAELGSRDSALTLGSPFWPNPLLDGERGYWSLLSICGGAHASSEDADRSLHDVIGQVTAEDLDHAFAEQSPLRRFEPSGPRNLPGRGLIATAFADAALRREYGFNYGKHALTTHDSDTPSTLEMYYLQRAIADVLGRASAFLLVPGDRTFADPSMISVPTDRLASLLTPIDELSVRCGPLAHYAKIYRIDRERGRVDFVDGLFEFWQPTHNPCVTAFDLVPFINGGFLASVPLRDVLPMIQGVITFRDRVPLEALTEQSDKFVTITQFQRSDFFKFFHLQQLHEEAQDDGGTLLRYAPGAFQNEIFLHVHVDKEHRINQAVMALKREWIGTPKVPNRLANDILKSFLVTLTPENGGSSVNALAKSLWENPPPSGGGTKSAASPGHNCLDTDNLKSVLYGHAPSCETVLPLGNLLVQNIVDRYSSKALQITIDTSLKSP
jgi:hypothetical protein